MSIAACFCLLGLALAASSAAAAPTTLTSVASNATLGNPIHDTATLAGGKNPFGTIVFQAFAPGDVTCASPVFTVTSRVAANGSFQSGSYTPTALGEYRWTASYAGDPGNEPSASACNAPNATSTVSKLTPTLTGAASNAVIGGTIADTVTLSGASAPGGTIAFEAFGPGDPNCERPVAFTSTVNVPAEGSYESAAFAPDGAGEYSWRASYSGDDRNAGATTGCGGTGGTSTVETVTPTISLTATAATVGNPIHATATVAGGHAPVGMLTFKVFGPDPTGCAGAQAASSYVSVSGDGAYDSLAFTPTAAGEYRWTAGYSGDGNNEPTGSGCEGAVTVGKASPTISTTATDAPLGRPVHGTATLGGGMNPGGSIVFRAYAPGDSGCSGPVVLTATAPVHGNGAYNSGDQLPGAIGEYRWTAAYSGDANDEPASSPCGAPGGTSTVARAATTLTTAASDAPVGGSIHLGATLADGLRAGGTVTFRAYGPDDTDCSGIPVFESTLPVEGNGGYDSGAFAPTAPGEYRWVVGYSGDAENMPVAGTCGGAGRTSAILPAPAPPSGTAPSDPMSPVQLAPAGPFAPSVPPPAAETGSPGASTAPPAALTTPAACVAPAAPVHRAAGQKKGRRRPVLGVDAKIRVPRRSILEVRTTLRFRLDGHRRTVKLARAWLAAPGKRKLQLAIPAKVRHRLPLGTEVHLSVLVAASPAAGLPCAAPRRSRLHFRTKVVKVMPR